MANYPTIDSCNDDWQRLLYTTAYSNGFEKAKEAILELHKEVSGPYDDTMCEHCFVDEYRYYEYPCPTVKLLGGNSE